MIKFKDFQDNWWRLRENDEEDIFDVMGNILSPSTKQAILTDINDAVMAAKEEVQEERRQGIKDMASKLPEDDKLRKAIEDSELEGVG